MKDPKISAAAKGLYSLLKTYCSRDKTCFPGDELLLAQMGTSKSTLHRWFKELEENNLIHRCTLWNHEKGEKVRLIRILDDVDSNKSSEENESAIYIQQSNKPTTKRNGKTTEVHLSPTETRSHTKSTEVELTPFLDPVVIL
jgi:hypothetical protein